MKRILIPALLAFTLGGCASGGGFGSSSGIKQIQDLTVGICRFVPTAQTVADILLSGSNAIVSSALAIATAICGAVTTNPLADGPGAKNYKPTVAGVRIRGQFVR